MLSYITAFFLALILHELGHAAASYACGVKIYEFGLGWGRKLFGFRIREVDYVVRVLPVGAYVRLDMSGLQLRPIGQQVLVLLGGIIINLVAAMTTGNTRFSIMNFLLAGTNILPLYQQDGWKCGMVMLRALLHRKNPGS